MSESSQGRYSVTEKINGIIIGDRENMDAWISVEYNDEADIIGEVPPWMIQCTACGDWHPPEHWGADQDVCADCLQEETMFEWLEGDLE